MIKFSNLTLNSPIIKQIGFGTSYQSLVVTFHNWIGTNLHLILSDGTTLILDEVESEDCIFVVDNFFINKMSECYWSDKDKCIEYLENNIAKLNNSLSELKRAN